jgi:hypothetical protein
MSPLAHKIYINTLIFVVLATTTWLFYIGYDYYALPLEERFYHGNHQQLKPSGILGHGLGIIGTLLILIGVFGYMARKRFRALSQLGALKYWLEFHIFLCVLGPIMVLFHTSFKFGGIVSISFWSMVAVVASGVLGRFIYLSIPRTIQGRELSLGELKIMMEGLGTTISKSVENVPVHALKEEILKNNGVHEKSLGFIQRYIREYKAKNQLRVRLKTENIPSSNINSIMKLVSEELTIARRVETLHTMQKYFRYWHVAHLPFAIIMLVIMIIHVAVTLAFGYTWVF